MEMTRKKRVGYKAPADVLDRTTTPSKCSLPLRLSRVLDTLPDSERNLQKDDQHNKHGLRPVDGPVRAESTTQWQRLHVVLALIFDARLLFQGGNLPCPYGAREVRVRDAILGRANHAAQELMPFFVFATLVVQVVRFRLRSNLVVDQIQFGFNLGVRDVAVIVSVQTLQKLLHLIIR